MDGPCFISTAIAADTEAQFQLLKPLEGLKDELIIAEEEAFRLHRSDFMRAPDFSPEFPFPWK